MDDRKERIDKWLPYVENFDRKLTLLINEALSINNVIKSGIVVNSFYSPSARVAAAITGADMNLPHEVAIAFMIVLDASAFEDHTSTSKLIFSSSLRNKRRQIQALVAAIEPVYLKYKDTDMPDMFFKKMISHMK